MIKKISAIVLALVLCLSIVVVPTSALSDGMDVKYHVALDKEYVSAGDTVTVSLTLEVADDREWGTGAFVFGMNSAVFSMDDNAIADIKASTTMSDLALSFYKDISSYAAWQTNATIINNIKTNNTDAENAMYDQYVKITFNRAGAAGSHDNSSNTKQGLPSAEINADYEAGIATLTFDLVVRDDVEDGTPVNIGIPTGSIAKSYSYYKYLKSPGTAQTLTTPTVATSEIVYTESVIGAAETPFPTETIVNPLKGQIRFHKDGNGAYANSFDVRALAVISGADFTATFGDVAAAESKITEVGFVFAAGNNVASPKFDAVQGLVENGTAADGYTKKTVDFISTTTSAGNYAFSCIVTDIPDADKGNSLVAVGYIAYTDANGATVYNYYPAAQTISYTELFDAHYGTAFGA